MDILRSVADGSLWISKYCMKTIYWNSMQYLNHAALLEHDSVCSARMKGKLESKSYLKQCLKCTECQFTGAMSIYTKYSKKHDWQRHRIDFRILCSINREPFPVPSKICLLICSIVLLHLKDHVSVTVHMSSTIQWNLEHQENYTTVIYLKCVFKL